MTRGGKTGFFSGTENAAAEGPAAGGLPSGEGEKTPPSGPFRRERALCGGSVFIFYREALLVNLILEKVTFCIANILLYNLNAYLHIKYGKVLNKYYLYLLINTNKYRKICNIKIIFFYLFITIKLWKIKNPL